MKKIRIIALVLCFTLLLGVSNSFALERTYNYIVVDVKENQEYTFDISDGTSSIKELYGESLQNVRDVFLAFTPEKSGKYVLSLKTEETSDAWISTERGIPSFAVHIEPSKSEPILTKHTGTMDEVLTETKEDIYYLRAGKTYYFVEYDMFCYDPLSVKIEYQGPVTKKDVMVETFNNATLNCDNIYNSESLKSGLKFYISKGVNYNVDGYEIYRSSKEYGVYKKIGITTKTYYIDKTVKEDKRYFYKVTAYRYIDGEKYTIKWDDAGKKIVYNYNRSKA